jgi:hypothetical protein
MICQACSNTLHEDWVVCTNCGLEITKNQQCPKCEHEIEKSWKVCGFCGQNLKDEVAKKEPKTIFNRKAALDRVLSNKNNDQKNIPENKTKPSLIYSGNTNLDRLVNLWLKYSKNKDEPSLHLGSNIPQKKLNNFINEVKKRYNISLSNRDIYGMYDMTLFCNGKKALAFTKRGIISTLSDKDPKRIISYFDIKRLHVIGKFKYTVPAFGTNEFRVYCINGRLLFFIHILPILTLTVCYTQSLHTIADEGS